MRRSLKPLIYLPLLAVIALAALSLGACGPMTQAGVDGALNAADEGETAFHVREAKVYKKRPCAMSVEGFNLALTAVEQDAVMTLCPGGKPALTLEELQGMNKALQQMLSGRAEPVRPVN